MPYNVTAFASVEDQVFQDVVPGGWRFTIDGPMGFQTVHSNQPQYTWSGLSPGDYLFTGVRVAADGITPIGTPKETAKNLPAIPVQAKRAFQLRLDIFGRMHYILWVPVPSSLQSEFFRPGAVSLWPFAVASENQAIANGEIREMTGTIPAFGLTSAEIDAALQVKWQAAVDRLQAVAAWPYENRYWTPDGWVQG